jgi:hypothetical protein
VGASNLGVGPLISLPLASWTTDAGLLHHPAGCTVVGIRYRLAVCNPAAPAVPFADFAWGFLVGDNPTTAADLDPSSHEHLDWLEWGRAVVSLPANSVFVDLVGKGDDGFRTVRSKRKMEEIEDDLMFVIKASTAGPFQFTMVSSVALMLP